MNATGVASTTAATVQVPTLARILTGLENVLAVGAAVSVFSIMLIVTVDVLMRYAFNAPLAWSFDVITIYLMGATFFLSLSHTLRLEHHVNVDLAYRLFPLAVRRVLKLVSWAASAAVFGWITWLALGTALDRYVNGDVIAGAFIWPTWIPAAIAALGFGVMVLRLVLGVVVLAARLLGQPVRVEAYAGSDVGDRPHGTSSEEG